MADDAISRRYAMLRKRSEQQGVERQQRESDELKRAEAQSGMQGSGAFIKQRQLAGEARNREIAQAKEALDVAESGERFQQDQIAEQRKFQSAEREAGQRFAGEQAKLGRDFARAERLGGQKFQTMEASRQRGFSKQLFDKEMAFKQKAQAIQESQFNQQFEQAVKQFQQQFDFDKEITAWNQRMAMMQFNRPDMIESLSGYDPATGGFSFGGGVFNSIRGGLGGTRNPGGGFGRDGGFF